MSKHQALEALTSVVGRGATGIVIEERSRSGRVTRMRALGAARPIVTGAQFRRQINAVAGWRTVKSTKFDLSLEGDRYVLRGGGFGHGVGMSQYGAMGQARVGRTYRDILSYYFVGTVLEGGRALPRPVLTAAEPIRPPEEPDPETVDLHSRYLLTEPRGRASRHRPGSGTSPPPGDPMQEAAPSSRDDRVGDRRSGVDRRAAAGRQTAGRRQSSDRRQTAYQAPAAETADTDQRRAAW